MKFEMRTANNPMYCKCDHECYSKDSPIKKGYNGKYYRPECSFCWCNTLAPIKKKPDRTLIKVVSNNSSHICSVCDKRLKQKEYVVNLGFGGRQVLIHVGCLNGFITKLTTFQKEKLPAILDKLTVEVL